ncbi:hypothetical protein CTI12_AA158570 [Artemisia annua]|uniref:Uncharacterized protein n=1 Tax=Artemisia annua TaxID=35608 RepID=A0A2U1PDU5_ARTAN|nr:hypothetical protein CTI12_AA158570 [Artemisia annua]
MVAHKDEETRATSVGNLTNETSKSASEEEYHNKVNTEVSRNVESSDVVQKSHEDVLSDTLEECDDVIKGGEVVSGDVIKGDEVVEIDVCKKIDGGDVNVNDDGVIKGDEISKDDEVVIADVINEGEFGGDDIIKVCEVVESDKNEGDADTNKSQSLVTSLRGRRKVFKSPSSFSYRRLLSYLQDTDSSNFEIVDAKLPEKKLKSGDNAPNMVAHGEQEISAVSVGINLTDESSKSASEEQYLYKVNPEVSRNVESSDVVRKRHDDVLNDTLEECEQMTPPDADIYSKPKTDKMLDVVVKPKPKPVLTPCSKMNLLQTPTSYTHRRLLPFLMSVAEDGTLKGNQSSKVTKGREQSQQPPTQSLSHQNLGMDEPKIISNPEQQDATNEKSDSPTSTLIPADTSFDRKKIVTLVSSVNLLDTYGSDMECSGSTTQLEVNSQSEAVEFDNSLKLELSPLKDNLKHVEEATVKAMEIVPNICTEQITDADNDFTGLKSSCSKDNQELVNESAHQTLQITPLMTPAINGENFRNGILKRTPRGCRGICNCLNCTSFRLHAERSFEFSRNQMHDAEEVALDLINDLTSLRKLLETTASDSNSLATDKEKQIKEACEKALYKEEVAKARLSQMNEDLSFHCRSMKLMRPKVTFANKIEEKFISKDLCGKKSV